MRQRMCTIGFCAALVCVFLPPICNAFFRGLSWSFSPVPAPPGEATGDARPLYRENFIQAEALTPMVHCPTVAELGDGNLLAVWYGGSREGASDVALYQSVWDLRTGAWTTPCLLTDVRHTQADLGRYVRKIGNAVLYGDAAGRLWLFYVSISAGGWSGSEIVCRISEDDGCHWSAARRLVTSPLLNKGTLVRGAAFGYADRSIGLPVYKELLGKRGELLRVGNDGTVLASARITRDHTFLQPSVVPLGASRAIAFLRNSGEASRRIFRTESDDGGRSWSAPWGMPLPNPDSAVMGIRGSGGTLWLVFNNMVIDRDVLSLARSVDGGASWKVVHEFETGLSASPDEIEGFSYPFIIRAGNGDYHLLYTWHRRRVKHVMFNEAWLRKLG